MFGSTVAHGLGAALVLCVLLAGADARGSEHAAWGVRELSYRPAPLGNPLIGFMPYRLDNSDRFPPSMEWFYVDLKDLMDGPESFTFEEGLEPQLNDIASRGHQAVFRVALDMPASGKSGVPQFLLDRGVRLRRYEEYGGGWSPDYGD